MIAGGVGGELRDALEHVLRRVRREVGDQLVVDRQVRRQHEEVVDAVRQVQVGDERAHQPGLADAGGEREAERRKLALEVGDRRELAADGRQRWLRCRRPCSGGAISVMRSRISSERRWGGRRLRRPAMALTWRFMAPPLSAVDRRVWHRELLAESSRRVHLAFGRRCLGQVLDLAGCSRRGPTRSG